MSQAHGNTWRKAPPGRKSGAAGPSKRGIRSGADSHQSRERPGKPVHPASSRGTARPGANTLMQELKPTVWIGKQGCTDTIIAEVIAQLKNRKTVKVKWLQNTEVNPEDLAQATGARLLCVRGRTLVLEERRRL